MTKEELRLYKHKWYLAHRKVELARSKKFYQEHTEEVKLWSRKYYHEHKNDGEFLSQIKQHRMLPHSKFLIYKNSAKSRGIPFELTFEQFMTFWQKPCYYCGNSIPTIGLDRVDNTKGYTMDNVVPCCKVCNRLKTSFPQDVFIEQCQKIAAFTQIYKN
jgi:hypothetical protein